MSHAAAKCDFANGLSAKNKVEETLHTDVRDMGETRANKLRRGCQEKGVPGHPSGGRFSLQGIFPEQNRQLAEQGFQPKESKLFSEIPRILSLLRRLAKPLDIEVHYIIENVKMKPDEHDTVCSVLNGIPTMIQASRVCAASRPQ